MSETVIRIRRTPGGLDDNNDPIPSAVTKVPLRAKAVAPGASKRNQSQERQGETIEHTVYFLPAPDLTDDDELEIMRRHARIGHDILTGSDSPMIQMAAEIALTHHEKYDGSGYPDGLAGDAIPLVGRIVAVADVFDALTSPRPYKAAWELERAASFLREGKGAHFDPACVDAFFDQWDAVLEIRQRFQDE